MRYMVNPIKIENDFMWEVYEAPTERVIDSFFFEEDAVRYAKFLESGGGFNGWTPNFILTEVVFDDAINQKFNMMFSD